MCVKHSFIVNNKYLFPFISMRIQKYLEVPHCQDLEHGHHIWISIETLFLTTPNSIYGVFSFEPHVKWRLSLCLYLLAFKKFHLLLK
jgi:hypothetical protein